MSKAKSRAGGALDVSLPIGATHFPAVDSQPPVPLPAGVRIRSRRGVEITFKYDGRSCTETVPGVPTVRLVHDAAIKLAAVKRDIEYNRFSYEAAFPDSRKVQKAARAAAAVVPVVESVRMRTLFEDFLRLYEQEHPGAANTLLTHREVVRSRLAPVFSDLRPDQVTPERLIEFRDGLRKVGLSDKRISNVLTPLRGAIALARERGLISENPFDRLRPTVRRRGSKVLLDESGLPMFDEELPTTLDPRYQKAAKQADPLDFQERSAVLNAMQGQVRNFFMFAFWSGLRTGELIALRWCDIDWSNNRVCVRLAWSKSTFTPTKGKRARWLQLTEPAKQALLAQQVITGRAGRWVFHNPKTADRWQNSERVRQHWISALQKAEVRYRKPYQTRHTYASLMVSAGEVPEWVADQMGHLDTRMVTEVYARWLRRPDMVPGVSAEKVYAEEWRQSAALAQRVNVISPDADFVTVPADDDDEALEWIEEQSSDGREV